MVKKSNRQTPKVCQKCGKPFQRSKDANYCEDCAKEIKRNSVVRIRVCQDCGVEFYGGPRAKRCSECAKIAIKITSKNRKSVPNRKIGSIDTCKLCGAEYVVNSGRQKYCSDECARIAVLQWQREHKSGYAKSSGQYEKRRELQRNQKKVCIYCGRVFSGRESSNTCSEYCHNKNKQIIQYQTYIRKGYNRRVDRLLEERESYRKQVQNETKNGAD
ncbi:MAG: hypothetical protein MR278_06755 [Bacteroidales bacterium]|nr:hypothetical protein [Anaerotignum sp.]MCI5679656.1 hypothetical protein [Bacteroidales bacterium]MDY3926581.1 hypothetical protein [Anaerotignum sp.]